MALTPMQVLFMATEAHGKYGIFTDNFCVFRGFRGYLS